ncbi:MAG: glycosyltransferase family 2 protein [Butyrivibrio sp.]|nr:glycosyltransferase family 2 protein [Butyrivibrio sp.]
MSEIVLGITTYNRLDTLKKSIVSLKSSKLPENCKFRIYDDHSTEYGIDQLKEIFPEAEVIYIQEQNQGSDGNIWTMYNDFVRRNKSGDIFVNCDSDLIYKKDWLYEAIKALKKSDGVLSVFNTGYHRTIAESEEFFEKEDIGSAGTVFDYEIVRMIIKKFPNIYSSAFDYKWCSFLRERGIRLLCTRRSLVQHIGIDGFNSDISSFDFGTGFEVDTCVNGQIINDVIEDYVLKNRNRNPRRFWYALFPFHLIEKDSRIVLYGAGDVAKDYLRQIECDNYCKVVAVLDTNRAGESINLNKNDNITIETMEYLKYSDEYDKVVISVRDEETANSIKDSILSKISSLASKVVYAGQGSIIRL